MGTHECDVLDGSGRRSPNYPGTDTGAISGRVWWTRCRACERVRSGKTGGIHRQEPFAELMGDSILNALNLLKFRLVAYCFTDTFTDSRFCLHWLPVGCPGRTKSASRTGKKGQFSGERPGPGRGIIWGRGWMTWQCPRTPRVAGRCVVFHPFPT